MDRNYLIEHLNVPSKEKKTFACTRFAKVDQFRSFICARNGQK